MNNKLTILAILTSLQLSSIALGRTRQVASRQTGPAMDEVVLHGGRSYRGTIAEVVPNQHLVIVTVTGKTLQFPMRAVSYSGPVRRMAPYQRARQTAPEEIKNSPAPAPFVAKHAPSNLAPVQGDGKRLRLESPNPEVGFHMLSGHTRGAFVGYSYGNGLTVGQSASRSYSHICAAPCEVKLPAGKYKLALSYADRLPIQTNRAVVIEQESTLVGRYEDNQNVRTLGWWVFGMGNTLGGVLMLASTDDLDTDMLMAGLAIGLLADLIGLILVSVDDKAAIDVHPLSF